MAAFISRSRLLPRSATRSLAPKKGEPAPGAPAAPKPLSGRSIWTAVVSEPPDSPPTIQAVDPITATPACDTGTWSRPAGTSRFDLGSNAQMVGTALVGDDEPESA